MIVRRLIRPAAAVAAVLLAVATPAQKPGFTVVLPMRALPADALPNRASAAEIEAIIRHAESTMKPGQPVVIEPIWKMGTSSSFIEVRRGNWSAATHPDIEMFHVLRGSGTLILGGTIPDAKPGANGNTSGSTIEGGQTIKIGAGDFFYVPEGIAHQFPAPNGELVMISMHVPRPGGGAH